MSAEATTSLDQECGHGGIDEGRGAHGHAIERIQVNTSTRLARAGDVQGSTVLRPFGFALQLPVVL